MADISQLIAQLTTGDEVPAIVKIVATIILGVIVNQLISRSIERLLNARDVDRRLVRQIGLISRYIIFFAVFILVLNFAGVTPTVLLTSLGIVGIAAGFAAQDLLSNLLNGIFLIFENTINVSDVVKIGDVYGIVRLIKLRTTEIRTFDNNIVSIPNSKLAQSNIINMTSGSKYSMTAITVKLGYDADFEKAKELMQGVVNHVDGAIIDSVHGVRFEVSNIGERYWGLNLTIYFFVEAINEPWIKSVAHQEIIEKLVEAQIPFHRDSPK
jgi:small-conductance mechanosensitive channel